jgi:membrane protein DedA with SNARE-associated domain
MSGYAFAKFLLFDIVGIVLWAFTFVSIGYYFGHNAIDLILFIQKNLVLVLFVLGLFLFLMRTVGQNDDEKEVR